MKKYRNYIIAALILVAVFVTICFIPISVSKLIPTVEKQVEEDLGIKIHIEKLILRLGPSLKVKAPIMHMMYEDGQKFGQFDNVRIFIPWSAVIKNDIKLKRIYANNLILKINSTDKYLPSLVERIKTKNFEENPDLTLKQYNISFRNDGKLYKIEGHNLSLIKLANIKNFKFNAEGSFFIDDNKYLGYDLAILPNLDLPENIETDVNYKYYLRQIEDFDFHSDIIADLKLYNNINGDTQISGLVNIDNMSVLEKDNKMPKSFIYLTFLGNKIGILSNVYAASDKKVCIEGMVNNSKKPEIDIKVKTDEINLNDLHKKLKLLTDFSKLKLLEAVNGTMTADFTLKGDLKKIKSNGYLKIIDASVKASGVDIKNINSDIDFSNNEITVKNAIGYVNNAPILLKGKMASTLDLELLMSKVQLKHLLPSSLGIENGILSLVANISGNLDNIIHKENIQIDNLQISNKQNKISVSSLKLDTNKENTAYINNLQIKPVFSEIVKLPLVKLNISNDIITIPDTNIFMPNSKMKFKADVSSYNTNDLTFNFNLDGFINSRDVYSLKSHSAIYPVKLRLSGSKELQNIESQIQLEKATFLDEPALINFAAKLDKNILKIDDLSVSSFNGNFSNNLKSNLKGQKKIIISGCVENLMNPIFKNIRVFIPQQLNISIKDTLAQIKGDVFINGKYSQPEIVGQLSSQSIINQFLQLAVNNMTVDFNKNIAVINAPVIKIADTSMTLNSTVSTDISKEIWVKNANIKSKYFNTDTVLMYKDNPILNKIPYKITDGKFFAEKANVSLYNASLPMSALNADFSIKNNMICAKNVAAEMLNGKIAGHMDYNLKDESFKSIIQGRGVSAAPIFDVIAIKKDTVSGTMDFDTDLTGNIINKNSLNGNVKFIVHNGRMGTLGKLEHLLYAQNVIADSMLRTSLSVVTKAITLKDTGLFKYLRGDIQLKDGVANVKMLQSQGPLMSLFIKGQYNTTNDYAKLVVLGRLSDELVSGLGAFGDFSFNKLMIMLTGEENKRLDIKAEDLEKLPQLPMRNTKEFRSIIRGTVEKPSSVVQFNWISYSQKSLRQKEVPMTNIKLPDFVESLPY